VAWTKGRTYVIEVEAHKSGDENYNRLFRFFFCSGKRGRSMRPPRCRDSFSAALHNCGFAHDRSLDPPRNSGCFPFRPISSIGGPHGTILNVDLFPGPEVGGKHGTKRNPRIVGTILGAHGRTRCRIVPLAAEGGTHSNFCIRRRSMRRPADYFILLRYCRRRLGRGDPLRGWKRWSSIPINGELQALPPIEVFETAFSRWRVEFLRLLTTDFRRRW